MKTINVAGAQSDSVMCLASCLNLDRWEPECSSSVIERDKYTSRKTKEHCVVDPWDSDVFEVADLALGNFSPKMIAHKTFNRVHSQGWTWHSRLQLLASRFLT